ncbi:VanW like protein [Trichlorobacter thiogenes]|uniref:VanW like protein n=1 Tax=Trichlorobacter thiogenes TaxID=115783 RepID=A0A1T4PR05_9BACT|nr:VanW family protein [Trichlorobacter thiogenes]SJZ94012.1 VanW like protein [Trichlorobacter thiogenes]
MTMKSVTVIFLFLLYFSIGQPALAADDAFSHIWGGFSTSLQLRSDQQRHNTATAARDLDHVIIAPGETFSFNERVGARDTGKGYRAAPIITATGLLEDIPGGGICQLASTIYNAGLLAGMEVVERHPHSRTVGHVPPGRDATIASWRKDLKLKNPHPYPLQLRIVLNQNRLTTSLYSPVEKPFTAELNVSRTRLVPDTVVITGTAHATQQQGASGFSTETRRIIKENGQTRDELISQDIYPAPSRVLTGARP